MKKKSLFDVAMEKKKTQNIENKNIIVVKKKSYLIIAMEIISKILKFIFFLGLLILLTIGATVLVNSSLREQIVNIIKINI